MSISSERAPQVLDIPTGPAGVAVLRAAIEHIATYRTLGTGVSAGTARRALPTLAPLPSTSPRISEEYRARLVAAVAPELACPDECDVVLTTSGSTGEPKAVMHTWSAIEHSTHALHDRLSGPGSWLCTLPLHTSAGFMTVARAVVANTANTAIDSLGGLQPFTAAGFVDAVADLPPGRAYVSLVPAMAQRLIGDGDALAALQRFDAVLLGGQATPAPLVTALREHGVKVALSYGMTETCGGCVYDGEPLTDVKVSFDDNRIRITGSVVMLGYRHDAISPLASDSRTFLTSDLGHMDNRGHLVIDGRVDDVVMINGVNISISAVEGLLRELGINAVACATDSMMLAATTSGLSPDETSAAIERVRAQLAVRIDFRVVPEIPMTAASKPDRAALAILLGHQA